MRLANGAEVAVRSTGGDAGVVSIQAGTFEMSDSLITAQAKAFGGSVDIKATELVYLLDSEVNALSEGGTNDEGLAGGNITIDPPAVVLNASRLIAEGSGNANGGNIFVTADPFLASTDSLLSASSEQGIEGTVVVDAPESELSSELASLPSDFLDPSALLREACLARDAPSGSFTVRGESRLRAPPDAPLPADLGACAGPGACPAP
jgi:large exoprotein involved in heme utilization and adhesion